MVPLADHTRHHTVLAAHSRKSGTLTAAEKSRNNCRLAERLRNLLDVYVHRLASILPTLSLWRSECGFEGLEGDQMMFNPGSPLWHSTSASLLV